MRFTTVILLASIFASTFFASPASGQTQSSACNEPAERPILHLKLPAHPFEPIPSDDGCRIFISMPHLRLHGAAIGVVRRSGGKVSLERTIPVEGTPTGMVLSHDGKLLIAAAGNLVLFLDTARMMSGQANPVVSHFSTGPHDPGSVYVNVTADDRFLFVSNENNESISVINLEKARASGFAADSIVGKIPVGIAPIAVTLSPDGRYLYTTSEAAPKSYGWPAPCKPEGEPAKTSLRHPEGAIVVANVDRAKTDPANSVIAKLPAGCSPVRLVLSPDGQTAYVTARNSNALLVFDRTKLLADPEQARIAAVPVGIAPVGLVVVDNGRKVIVTNSNRFSGKHDKQNLSVIDTANISSGPAAILGLIPAGAFPRELRATADGRTLLVTNFDSNTLDLIDLTRLPIDLSKR